MTKIGFNVLAWSAVISDDMQPIVQRLASIGYEGVEFFVGSSELPAYKKMGEFAKSLGLEVTTVFVLGEEENPVSADRLVREKAVDRIKWAIDRAYDLHSRLLCGPFHSPHAVFPKRAPESGEYTRAAEVLHRAGEHAAQAGVILALEALNRFECYLCNTMEQLAHLIKLADHPQVKAMFDTHHANMEEKKFEEAIKTIAPHLAHVHISENDRGTPGAEKGFTFIKEQCKKHRL